VAGPIPDHQAFLERARLEFVARPAKLRGFDPSGRVLGLEVGELFAQHQQCGLGLTLTGQSPVRTRTNAQHRRNDK